MSEALWRVAGAFTEKQDLLSGMLAASQLNSYFATTAACGALGFALQSLWVASTQGVSAISPQLAREATPPSQDACA